MAKGQVLASVTARAGLPTSKSALSAALPSELLAGTQLTVVDKPVGTLTAAFGGMVDFDTTAGWCTSGWPVRHNTTGVIGVTTAGHCFGIGSVTGSESSARHYPCAGTSHSSCRACCRPRRTPAPPSAAKH
ncbi:hypothetical protein O7627_18255 [Solwaraspora sp. WMMD1047]|uniref:hypothetical protein n=1 Tax=Solwaraspora sp. WMMD1047 TaxID=3016102 RepID=UPI0024171394|nr:hypothetical protein [Solwaraspora sp. WMMD1047]MDG4831242.1 hypothetical protein [Solwaraspora sp. WMMD1047]